MVFGDPEHMVHMFEMIHFSLFFVMVVFLFGALWLLLCAVRRGASAMLAPRRRRGLLLNPRPARVLQYGLSRSTHGRRRLAGAGAGLRLRTLAIAPTGSVPGLSAALPRPAPGAYGDHFVRRPHCPGVSRDARAHVRSASPSPTAASVRAHAERTRLLP